MSRLILYFPNTRLSYSFSYQRETVFFLRYILAFSNGGTYLWNSLPSEVSLAAYFLNFRLSKTFSIAKESGSIKLQVNSRKISKTGIVMFLILSRIMVFHCFTTLVAACYFNGFCWLFHDIFYYKLLWATGPGVEGERKKEKKKGISFLLRAELYSVRHFMDSFTHFRLIRKNGISLALLQKDMFNNEREGKRANKQSPITGILCPSPERVKSCCGNDNP